MFDINSLKEAAKSHPVVALTRSEVMGLVEEIERLKNGIKTCETTMIVDGNDMYDWGWMTILEHNLKTCNDKECPKYMECPKCGYSKMLPLLVAGGRKCRECGHIAPVDDWRKKK